MKLTTYYLIGAVATIVVLLWLISGLSTTSPILYLYIGFLICLQVVYHVLRASKKREEKNHGRKYSNR